MMRKQFCFKQVLYESIRHLPDQYKLKFFIAITEYGLFGKEPKNFDKEESNVWRYMKPFLNEREN